MAKIKTRKQKNVYEKTWWIKVGWEIDMIQQFTNSYR